MRGTDVDKESSVKQVVMISSCCLPDAKIEPGTTKLTFDSSLLPLMARRVTWCFESLSKENT